MRIDIKRIDKELPIPIYETEGSVAFDFVTREDTTIAPQSLGYVPGNVIVRTPTGYMLLVALRSSTPRKKKLLCPHGIGIIDNDYCGEGDEIKIQVFNYSMEPVQILRGEKIAQGMFLPVVRSVFNEVPQMEKKDRGGFGSTDKKETKETCATKYCVD